MAKLFLLAILGIVFLIATLVCLIFGILAFANSKPGKWTWLTCSIISIIGLVLCIVLFTRKVIKKASGFAQSIEHSLKAHPYEEGTEDKRTYLLDSLNPNPQVQLIRSYLPDSAEASVPDDFYTYFGFSWLETYYRYPLRYPYALHGIILNDDADLYNEAGITDFAQSDNNGLNLDVHHIRKLAYDQHFLLLELGQTPEDRSYMLFVFDSETKFRVDSEAELFKLATEKGYKGPPSLMTLFEYNQLFF
ncbi:MAG: hypothetical protein JST26_04330 [Bacteroidetes bacterium]|nr:hypothetical protein [Bacteroidota bacterium]